jgi:hypothetical protein
MGVLAEARFKWCFGATASAEGGAVLGSTGEGTAFGCLGLARENTFYVESANNANSTGSYQIRSARTSSGPWCVLSSGTLTSNQQDIVQISGPFAYFSPRVKTLQSTAGLITIEYLGN